MENNNRIPEGGAIKDTNQMNMEKYSSIMKKRLESQYIEFADNVISKVNPKPNSRVLEIGSGPGWAGIHLLKKRTDLTLDGLEPSPDMIRVATSNASDEGLTSRINYIPGVGEDMHRIPDENYDLTISRASLHHWDEPERVFSEIHRVLKPDGKLYIQDSRRDINLIGRLIVNIIGTFKAGEMFKYWKSSIAASYTPQEIKEMLNKISTNHWTVDSDILDLSILKY